MTKSHVQYLRKHWKQGLWIVFKQSVAWLSVCLATYSALLKITPTETNFYHTLDLISGWLWDGWLLPIILLVIAAFSIIKNWPRMIASYTDERTHTTVIVEYADLLAQAGQKVIHSVDTFDTSLGTIITPRSLHGAFLTHCQEQQFAIDAEIDNALRGVAPTEQDEALPGRKARYPLGTICPIYMQDQSFALVSFARLQADGSIQITRKEYIDFLMRMWENLSKPNIREEVVNVAVIGNQFVDLPSEFTTEQKIDMMTQTFFAVARNHTTCSTLRICVHDKNASEVDFYHYPVIIEHLAQRPEIF